MAGTRRAALATLAVGLAAGGSAAAQDPTQTVYLFLYEPGPAWVAGQPMHKQALGPHAAFIKRQLAEGRLVAGGPFTDADGGMAIVRAASLEEARALLATDPAVTAGVFKAVLHGWQPRFDSGEPLQKR